MLALAHHIQLAIERGAARDGPEMARRVGLARARVTQLLELTLLAPDVGHLVLTFFVFGSSYMAAVVRRRLELRARRCRSCWHF